MVQKKLRASQAPKIPKLPKIDYDDRLKEIELDIEEIFDRLVKLEMIVQEL